MKLLKITLLAALGFAGAAQAADIGEILNKLNYHGIYTDSNEYDNTTLTIGKANQYAEIPFTFRINYRDKDFDPCVIQGYAKAIGNHKAFYQSTHPSAAMAFSSEEPDGSIDYCTASFKFKRGSVEYLFSDCPQCSGGRAGIEGTAKKQIH